MMQSSAAGLYIHAPFCRKKCPYCSFYSVSSFDDEIVKRYFDDCLSEIRALNKKFRTIYIGGGTPSIVNGRVLEDFLSKLDFNVEEFTIEANPESVTDGFISAIKGSQINRVSLGVQSFDDEVLKLLGRIHDAKGAERAIEKLQRLNIDINLDMIFDIPNISKDKIFATLDKIIAHNPSHVSAYSYTSSDTGYLSGFDEDETQFMEVEERLNKAGIQKYETSNFAKIGKASKHNSIYWSMGEYIGIGSASHSMVYENGERVRYSRPLSLEFLNKYDIYEKLDNHTAFRESLILGLRLKAGISILDIEARFGKIEESLEIEIDKLINLELLEWHKDIIKATERGALVLEHVSSRLL